MFNCNIYKFGLNEPLPKPAPSVVTKPYHLLKFWKELKGTYFFTSNNPLEDNVYIFEGTTTYRDKRIRATTFAKAVKENYLVADVHYSKKEQSEVIKILCRKYREELKQFESESSNNSESSSGGDETSGGENASDSSEIISGGGEKEVNAKLSKKRFVSRFLSEADPALTLSELTAQANAGWKEHIAKYPKLN